MPEKNGFVHKNFFVFRACYDIISGYMYRKLFRKRHGIVPKTNKQQIISVTEYTECKKPHEVK